MHSSGYRLGIFSGLCINRQKGRVQILFFYFIFYLIYFYFVLPSGGGSVQFVHPRKYAPGVDSSCVYLLGDQGGNRRGRMRNYVLTTYVYCWSTV